LDDLLTGPVADVAPRLLGAELHHAGVTVRLTEVEAYGGAADPASHASRGRTARNAVMFGPPGRLYCYLSHGIHVCANVSVADPGGAAAILLSARDIIEVRGQAQQRRGQAAEVDLARGPGRLTRALAITLDRDGCDLAIGPVRLVPPRTPAGPLASGPRIGVRQAADRPWRFWIEGAEVSRYRRHQRAEDGW
jgi:DNA-3-methyladenine glycosylase